MILWAIVLLILLYEFVDWDDFFRPAGCPKCGAPEPPETGWVRCPECGHYFVRP